MGQMISGQQAAAVTADSNFCAKIAQLLAPNEPWLHDDIGQELLRVMLNEPYRRTLNWHQTRAVWRVRKWLGQERKRAALPRVTETHHAPAGGRGDLLVQIARLDIWLEHLVTHGADDLRREAREHLECVRTLQQLAS